MEVTDIVRLPPWSTPREWMRIQWVSQAAKTVWESRLSKIQQAFTRLELESVYHGIRHSALTFKTPEELVKLTQEALTHGAVAFPLSLEGESGSAYSAGSTQYVAGKPFKFRVIVTKDPAPWIAHQKNDESTIGKLLGYPTCCSDFYKKTWVDEQWRDPTWPMFLNTHSDGRSPYGNILLRWVSIRFIRHLPCSMSCAESSMVGNETYDLGVKLGLRQEMDWARDLLSMNVEWTSKNGIAEIKTPLFRFSTNSDPLSPKAVVKFRAVVPFIPEEAATALAFPFVQIEKRKFSTSKSFANSLENPDSWVHNGFSSRDGMEKAHAVLLETLDGTELDPGSDVLDLGCGNGILVEKVVARYVGVTAHGVELNPVRAKAAYDRLPGGFVFPGNITDLNLWDQSYDLIIFMPGRLAEMTEADRLKVMQQLVKADRVLLYTYQDHKVDFPVVMGTYFTVRKYLERDGIRTCLLVNTGVSHASSKG